MSDRAERKDQYGIIRLMAEAEGHVMVRRPRAVPFVLSKKEWDKLLAPDRYDEMMRPYAEAVAKAWAAPDSSLAGR